MIRKKLLACGLASTIVFGQYTINADIVSNNPAVNNSLSGGEEAVSTDSFDEFSEATLEMVDEYELVGDEDEEFATGRLVVKTTDDDLDTLDAVSVVDGYDDYTVLQFDSVEAAEDAYEYYSDLDCVESVDKDVYMEICDSWYYNSWGYSDYKDYNKGINLNWFNEVYPVKNSSKQVVVAVVDTGVDRNHQTFMDSNNNSRVLPYGFNAVDKGANKDSNPIEFETNDIFDDSGHGTHVAGIIAEGTPDNVKILSVKSLNSYGGGSSLGVWLGIEYATLKGSDVINISLVGEAKIDYIEKAINDASDKGIIVCVAAGNKSTDASKFCPANCERAITVGASNTSGDICSFSNRGSMIDIFAPGQQISSANLGGGYATLSGTSQASPHVAAVAALFKLLNSNVNTDKVISIMRSSANDNGFSNASCYYQLDGTSYNQPLLVLGQRTRVKDIYTGLAQESDGNWYYYQKGSIDTTCNDLIQNNYGWWLVRNGKVDFGYNGIAKNKYGEWYIKNGKVMFNVSGICYISECTNYYGDTEMTYPAGNYYFEKGCLKRITTVAQNHLGWWYVNNGMVDFSANTVAQNKYGWWVIQNGKVNFNFTGIAENQNGKWYCIKGKVSFDTTSVVQSQGQYSGWYYVVRGMLQENKTDVAQNPYGWWYIGMDGKVDFTYCGTASNKYGTWNIVNGKVVF